MEIIVIYNHSDLWRNQCKIDAITDKKIFPILDMRQH